MIRSAAVLQYLIAGLAFGSAGGFLPGPTLTLVISQTLRHGVREGLKIAFAPLLTDGPIILLSIFVLDRIDTDLLLGVIAFAGAGFLAYLAWESFTARPPQAAIADVAPASLRKGFLANVLNPHPWVFWLTIGAPTTLRAWDAGPTAVVLFLVAHYVCLIGAKVIVALLVERSKSRLGRGYGFLMKLLGAVLLVFAVLFVREALGYFI